MTQTRPYPGSVAPNLSLPLVGGGMFDIATADIDSFLLVDFYRGLHCPRCRRHLSDLGSKLAHFDRRGVSAIAVSMDDANRAMTAAETWHIGDLPLAYGMAREMALDWGLFLSEAINDRETSVFYEPATFLITGDRKISSIMQNSTPFARFHFADLLEAIDAIEARAYPARGTFRPSETDEE